MPRLPRVPPRPPTRAELFEADMARMKFVEAAEHAESVLNPPPVPPPPPPQRRSTVDAALGPQENLGAWLTRDDGGPAEFVTIAQAAKMMAADMGFTDG